MGGNKSRKPSRMGKGKLVENKDNGAILYMEHDYGRIRTELEFSDEVNDFVRKLICETLAHVELEKGAIKRHLTRMHSQM